MAPSGPPASKAKAEPKKVEVKPKKVKKVVDEDEAPKMAAPDYEAHQVLVKVVQDKIDVHQKQAQALTGKINERSTGKEDYFAKTAVVRAELEEVSKEMDAIQEQRTKIRALLGEKKTESAEIKTEVSKMKKGMAFSNVGDIDARIKAIEDKMLHESISLKEEKAYMVEIKELKKNKPKLNQLSEMKDKLDNFDFGTDLKGKREELNEAFGILYEKKKEIMGRLNELRDEWKSKQGDVSEERTKREELQKKVAELITERNALRDAFGEQKREFQIYLNEQRRIKQERYQEDRAKQQQEWKVQQLERKVAALDEQPFVSEIVLIEQTEAFCKSLMPQAKDDKKDEVKETTHNNKDGEMVLASKASRDEEMYYVPTRKGKAAKKKGGAGEDGGKKPIKHNAETFKLFDSLKLDAPITTADIPALLEKLAEQKAMYEGKVKKWENEREEMKRKILAGEVEEEAPKEAAKEPEKEEEKEEAKEDEKEEEKEAEAEA